MSVTVTVKKLTFDDLQPGDYFTVDQPLQHNDKSPRYYMKVNAPLNCPTCLCMTEYRLVNHHSQTAVKRYRGKITIEMDER